jgi:hypothetical protein
MSGQPGVQRVDGVGPAPEHPVDPDGQRHLLAEILQQGQVGHLEVPVRGAPGQGQHAVLDLAVHQRHGQHRGGLEQRQQRRPVHARAERVGVLGVRDQGRVPRLVHGHRDGAGWRVDRGDRAGQLGQPGVVGAGGE